MRKYAPRGAPEAFIRANSNYSGEDCLLWPYCRTHGGYGLVVFNGRQSIASRIMCTLAHGEAPSKEHHAAHSCGAGHLGCVNPRHLSWKSPSENCADKKIHGTENVGVRNGKTKLRDEDIVAIRSAPRGMRVLMERYGVSQGCISKIRAGTRWGHVS